MKITKQLSKQISPETATFAAGCFWGVEAAFRKLKGVIETTVGYSGGTLENPSYKDVCSGNTGHAEVVLVEYDPAQTTFEALLSLFWDIHDPTSLNRQGPDIGSQYRSAIFYHSEGQRKTAESSRKSLQESGRLEGDIVTEIKPALPFWKAEDYHQRYLEKHGESGCSL